MIVSCDEMKALESRAFASGSTPESLMEEAGRQISRAILEYGRHPTGHCIVVFGKGHNGGDALVAARYLHAHGWTVELRPAFPRENWAPLTAKHAQFFDTVASGTPCSPQPPIILDGLLGIGAGGPLREPIRTAVREINRLRMETPARVIAIDLPTGVDADTGLADPDAVVADVTLSIGFAKKGLLADSAVNHVGRLAVLPLAPLTALAPASDPSASTVATPAELRHLLLPRKFESNKSDYGRIGIIAGAFGTTGAAILSATGALRGGGGLITLFATRDIYPILATAAPHEIMVRPVDNYHEALDTRLDVLAIGPGVGRQNAADLLHIISSAPLPMVLDADALNIVAEAGSALLDHSPGPRLLTPHPGEMARLFPSARDLSRRETAARFTTDHPVTLLLKGSRTLVAQSGQAFSYNTTGNPGMATGGMGDLLTGVCAALIGQGLSCYDAARLGAWLCGRAAELSIALGQTEQSLTPSDLAASLGRAFACLRAETY